MAERFPRSDDEQKRWSPKNRYADEGIDYRAEGRDSGEVKKSRTDEGYDEAAHSGRSRFGELSGSGGVFGTSGGGTFDGGFRVIEPPGIADANFGDRDIEGREERRETVDKDEAEKVSQFDSNLDR
jgi:hypothetical protein